MTKRRRDRFERSKIIVPILLAGWIPSVLTLLVSYTILRDTLESRILRDRHTLVQLLGHVVGTDLSRSSSIINYYETLPEVARILSSPNPAGAGQQWVNSAFYSHPNVDGMFLAGPDGALLGSIPTDPDLVGKDFGADYWRQEAVASDQPVVSPVHPRLSDGRLVTDIVAAVRAADGTVLGFVGDSVLVERIGKRLSTIEFSDRFVFQVLDQKGAALFDNDFKPNPRAASPESAELLTKIRQSKNGHFDYRNNLYSFSGIESTGWVALVEQPLPVAYKPVHDLLGRMTVLTAWLVVLTAVFAWLGSRFYHRQLQAKQQLEREVIFNEKMLANMPGGIALVDPSSRRFLHANDAFARMAQRFGDTPTDRDITEITCDDVRIAPPGAVERVLNFGTPFQLIEHPLKDKSGVTHFLDINLLRLQGAKETIQGVLYLVEDRPGDVPLGRQWIAATAGRDNF